LLDNLSPDFSEQYLGIQNYTLVVQPDFVGAAGEEGFADLPVDTSKITVPTFNQRLPSTMIFDTTASSQVIYRFQSGSGIPAYQNKPCAVAVPLRTDTTQSGLISLGFPLYFIRQDSARVFMVKALELLGEGGSLAVRDTPGKKPLHFYLFQNYPNPFNPVTIINYQLPIDNWVTLKVFDILGREVKTLLNEHKAVGTHTVQWDGTNDAGEPVGSGVYFYRFTAGENFVRTNKMILMK
ncbi:MAG: FlgD immunoglobulin-like domain containing protein, partial [Calditrichia bacterium]